MSPESRIKMENFLEWLITPQNDKESKLFKDKGLVDDYITILNSIPLKTDNELLDSIDIQLAQFNTSLDRSKIK